MLKFKFLLLVCMLLVSCYDDFDNSTTIVIDELPKTEIDTDLNGRVLIIDDTDIAHLELEINNETYPLIENKFYLPLQNVTKKGQNIFLKKDEQIIALSRPLLLENDVNYVELHPFEINQIVQYLNTSSAKYTISTGIELSINENAFKSSSNITEGEIQILYSNDINVLNQLSALGSDQARDLYLDVKEVFGVSLQTNNVSDLILDPGKAMLDIPNSSDALFELTSDGDLVFVSELNGSPIPIRGNQFFVVAQYEEGIYAEGSIKRDDISISYLPMTYLNNSFTSTAKGRWSSAFKVETESSINTFTACKDLLDIKNIALKSVLDTPQGKVSLNNELSLDENSSLFQIQTKIIDCSGQVGQVQATQIVGEQYEQLFIFNEGTIDTWLPICGDNFQIAGVDVITFNIGPEIDWSLMQEDDVFYLSSCEEFKNGFSYIRIRNDEKVYPAFDINLNGAETRLADKDKALLLKLKGSESRAYLNEEVNIVINDPSFGAEGYAISCENSELGCGIQDCKVTHFDFLENGWIRVKFSGTLWMQTISPPVAGNFTIEGVILTR